MSNPAFGGSPVTPNQAFDPSQDKTTPNFRSLNQGGMSSPAALAGTTGAEVELVHGDWQQQIDGSGTVSILKNLTTTITLKETRTVVGNLINKVVGTTSDTRIGIHHQWNVSSRFENYAHTLSQDHHETMVIHQPTTTWDIINQLFTRKIAAFSATGLSLSTTAVSASLGGQDASAKIISISNNVFAAKKESFAVKDLDIGLHVRGMITEIKAVKIKAAISHLKAIGANLCAGIAANFDSPWA